MGFYGNITNTSKTTFQFDKTYSNRNQMMLNAGNDGVYPGRFVLVDYDVAIDNDYFYKPDPLNPNGQCWMYDGQIYTGAPTSMDINGVTIYKTAPDIRTQLNVDTAGFAKGRCVMVPIGQRISDINKESIYKQVTKRTETGFLAMTITKAEYDAFMKTYETENPDAQTYFPAEVYDYNYEPNVYYTTTDGETYNLATGTFNEETTYYERAVAEGVNLFIVGNAASDVVMESTWVSGVEIQAGTCYHVKKGQSYSINAKYDEYWVLANDTDPYIWRAAADNASTYTLNASIDRAVYGSGRGYDSTVWQKVIKKGRDTYVMIAELNSVVPTFDITADAPSTIPLVPHFDKDSTNIYYKLHVQPSWSIRTKAARPNLEGPAFDKTGAAGGAHKLTTDTIHYPSDQTTLWASKMYNAANGTESTVYFNPNNSTWEPNLSFEDQKVGAAVYFNSKGFDSTTISKSEDLITENVPGYNKDIAESGWTPVNKIELKPTGLSGQRYDTHNATAEDTPQVDTQELSIMLPALGDAISHVWDIVYGGRDTNAVIRQTNTRNEDIEWENARGGLNRNGLRLVSSQDGNAYSTAEVNTLAGCINSVHDLMGMIITPETYPVLSENLDLMNTDRIYFVQPDANFDATADGVSDLAKKLSNWTNSYVRKQLTYKYTPVSTNVFDYEITAPETEDFNPADYWVKNDDGTFRTATQADVDAGKALYKKIIKDSVSFDPAGLTPFDGTKYFYQDFTSSENLNDLHQGIPEIWLKDYVRDDVYHPGHNYYTIDEPTGVDDKTADLIEVPLSGAYFQDTYFYKQNGNYLLDPSITPVLNRLYYKIDENKVLELGDDAAGGYDGIYVPGKYYILDEASGEYRIDNEPEGTYFGNKKAGHFAIKKDSQESDKPLYVQQTIYVPISYKEIIEDGFDYDLYIYDEGSSLYLLYTEETIDPNKNYFLQEIRLVPTSGHLTIEPTPLRLALYQPNTFFFKDYDEDGHFTGYSVVTPDKIEAVYDSEQKFYVFGVKEQKDQSGDVVLNFVFTETEKNNNPDYACKLQSTFYVPHRYHFLTSTDGKGSYLLDHYRTKTHNPYYIFQKGPTPVPSNIKFYEPNKYYTQNPVTGEYEIVRDPQMPSTQEKPLFEKKTYYVIKDTAGIYEEGAEWNIFTESVPSTVTLGTREEVYDIVQLPGFARNLNTIHGLILKINQLLLTDDKYTRDRTTIQGTLNTLNDIINLFDKMKPSHILMVDEYGRIQSADWNTQQQASSDVTKKNSTTYRKGVGADIYPTAANVDAMEDQWITMNVNDDIFNPLITIHHNYQKVTDQPYSSDMNGSGDTAVFYNPIVDKMGHVVGSKMHTLTFPYGFKTIKVTNTADTAVSAPATTVKSAGQIADNTQDTLTFAATNRWIKLDNNTEDTIKIGHLLSPFVTGTKANTLYGLTANQTVSQLDADNTFEVPCFQFDEAGHILEARTHTIALPENFTKHVTTLSDVTNADSTVGTVGEIVPDTLTDTLTFAEGNRWINLAADANNDKLTISHYVKNFTETTSALDFNNAANGKTFTVQTIGWDRAGHLISSDKKTFTLPDNFKTLAIGNTGKAIVSFDTATDGNLVADTLVDTATFDIGNRWLAYVANANGDKVTLYHTAPDANSASTNTTQTGNETPNFGATFLIPEVKYDEAGHIFKVGTHTVKIPLPSLENDTTGNVMTNLELEPATGKFTITKENLSSLALTGYTKGSDNGDVAATDTLAEALSKLQTQINDEENARAKAIRDLLGGEEINAAFDTIKEISDWLSGNDSGADGIIDAIATLTGADDVDGSVKKQIKDAIEALDATDEAVTGKYISEVSQTDGKITVKREELPTYTLTSGEENGTVKLNEEEVKVTGLGTAAFKNEEDFALADILETATFEYIVPTEHIMPADDEITEGEEIDGNGADDLLQNEEEIVVSKQTIAWLFNKVAELEARIKVLEGPEEEEVVEEPTTEPTE